MCTHRITLLPSFYAKLDLIKNFVKSSSRLVFLYLIKLFSKLSCTKLKWYLFPIWKAIMDGSFTKCWTLGKAAVCHAYYCSIVFIALTVTKHLSLPNIFQVLFPAFSFHLHFFSSLETGAIGTKTMESDYSKSWGILKEVLKSFARWPTTIGF